MNNIIFLERTATRWNPSRKDQSGFKSLTIAFQRTTTIMTKHLFAKKT